MKTLLLSSLVFVFLIGILCLPSASALPVSYNTTSINLGLTSVPRNSSSYDVFPLIPDNWLWEKFDNNTVDSSPLSVNSTITYNTNLIRMYHFEGTLLNSITGAVNGTVTGTTTYTGGHEGQGFSFNGASYISIGNSGSLAFERNNIFNLSFWYKGNDADGTYLISKEDSAGVNRGYAVVIQGSGKVQFELINTNPTNLLQVRGSTTITDNNWHHIVITYSGSSAPSGVNIYVDGVLNTPSTISNTLSATILNSIKVQISGRNGANSLSTSIIDELRWYGTSVLTQAQVSALYEVGHYSQSHTFDGGEYITSNSQFMPTGTQDRTESFWIYLPSYPSSLGYVTSYGVAAGNNMFGIGITSTGNVDVVGSGNDVTGTAVIPLNTWTFVTVKLSSGGTLRDIYINNVLDKESTTTALNTSTSQLYIGTGFYNTALTITGQLDNLKVYPYALSSSQITSDYNSISPISSGKQYMSYYNGISGSSTLTNKLGYGATTTLLCSLNSAAPHPRQIVSNGSNIYYACAVGVGEAIKKFDVIQNTNTHVYTSLYAGAPAQGALFMGIKHIFSGETTSNGATSQLNSEKGNVSQGGVGGSWFTSNQQIQTTSSFTIKFNDNSTAVRAVSNTNLCNINYNPTNLTKQLDSIACDQAVPAMAIKYWNGMMIQKIGGYNTNSTQLFLNSIDASPYKKLLTLPCALYGAEAPCITFILTDQTQTDYLVVLTSAHVYYGKAQTALGKLNNNNYGFQSYDIITQGTSSSYEIQNPILQSLKLYGSINLNSTVSKAGLFTLPSGYTVKTTSIESAIRTIDPRWTNDATDIPIITSTSSLFPIFLTVSNAPVFSAIKVTNPYQLINSQEAVWAVAQLDSTRTVEFDLPSNVCVNVYVADISVSPSIWNFQGIICASGVNQKTISYTNTLPFTFWTYPWGASDSFTPNTNGLVTTVRHTTAPFSYNIVLKNSTGTVFQNTTYTSNSTIDTQSFNLTGRAKPVSLYISSVTGGVNQIYSAFLGSPISLASTASFFNQYFSYQGFNLLAFIPIIFASMFTRNTIGIGVVLTVLCIATLSWLSVVVIPELDIMIMIVIAIIGLIAYRLTYY